MNIPPSPGGGNAVSDAKTLLDHLEANGFTVTARRDAAGGKLSISPPERIDAELAQRIKTHAQGLGNLVAARQQSPPGASPPSAPDRPATHAAANAVLDFGKHKGKPLREVESRWLMWATSPRAKHVEERWRIAFLAELERRGLHRPTERTPLDDGGVIGHAHRHQPRTPAPPSIDPLLSPDDLAALLKVHKKTILRKRKEGKLPKAIDRLGVQVVRWHATEIAVWMRVGMPPEEEWEQVKREMKSRSPPTATERNREQPTATGNREQPTATDRN